MSTRRFLMSVDSGSHEEPPTRYFGSLDAAIEAWKLYPPKFRKFTWIVELRGREGDIVHMRDGVRQ